MLWWKTWWNECLLHGDRPNRSMTTLFLIFKDIDVHVAKRLAMFHTINTLNTHILWIVISALTGLHMIMGLFSLFAFTIEGVSFDDCDQPSITNKIPKKHQIILPRIIYALQSGESICCSLVSCPTINILNVHFNSNSWAFLQFSSLHWISCLQYHHMSCKIEQNEFHDWILIKTESFDMIFKRIVAL